MQQTESENITFEKKTTNITLYWLSVSIQCNVQCSVQCVQKSQ